MKRVMFYIFFFLVMVGAGIYLVLSLVIVKTPEGNWTRSNWQKEFTGDFKKQIVVSKEQPVVSEEGLELLKERDIALQIIDTQGNEVFSYLCEGDNPKQYSNIELLEVIKKDNVYEGNIRYQNQEWIYLLRFPKSVVKVMMYLNANQFTNGRAVGFMLIGIVLSMMFIVAMVYGYYWVKNIKGVLQSIEEIEQRNYLPITKKNAFASIYRKLNMLEETIRESERLARQTERLRNEWISNITHDLKTPLVPIKGYAEMIAQENSHLTNEEVRQYAGIMLKNINYSEALINDLKLTYQLESGTLPHHKEQANIVRFLKEVIIDLLNQPDYMNKEIEFESAQEEILIEFDKLLLKRAFNNLLVNSLVHNSLDTEVKMTIINQVHEVQILICDNGKGIKKEELTHLFDRYYRGTHMKDKPEGTGLGMAIAKQIIEFHGGEISVASEMNKGTCFEIRLAKN
ncbi:MAG: HAMP domain-containing histidine kinase [Cellulosilyticum sp.]|nr:HAMP domain-containing histidine kinase [Cellulosilyticum sp.]